MTAASKMRLKSCSRKQGEVEILLVEAPALQGFDKFGIDCLIACEFAGRIRVAGGWCSH